MEEETNLDSGMVHICTEQPCPVEEAHIAKVFELGVTTEYTK